MDDNSLALAPSNKVAERKEERVHRYGKDKHTVCVTDDLGERKNEWRSEVADQLRRASGGNLTEIVVGVRVGAGNKIPLWDEGCTLRWRFNDVSMQAFANPDAAKRTIEAMFLEAVGEWKHGCPVKFERVEERQDFEIAMRSQKRCSPNGCVLASAFFPDGGQHELVLYPSMFEQSREEQIETLVHEIGHIFGLRHFFALIEETDWPAQVYGEHSKFSIMNYGEDSKLTDADIADLRGLYENAWARKIVAINGTQIKLMRPFSTG